MRSNLEFCLGKKILKLPRCHCGLKVFADDGGSDVKGECQFSFAFAGVSPIDESNIH